jgi:oligopeptide transport system permease protein
VLAFTLKRLLSAIPTLLLVIATAFFLIRIAPGGPFDSERNLPADIRANIERSYHLDQPLVQQFGNYLQGIVKGDFGPSYHYLDRDVSELIAESFPVSLQLGLAALALSLMAGIGAGTLAALRQHRLADHALMGLAMTGISIPNFVLAPLLVLIFAVHLHWLPAGGWGGLSGMVLPTIALALPQVAYIARLTRASLLDVLGSDFLRTARAKGLTESQAVMRHAMKPTLLPVVSYLGPATAALLTGSVVIEQIFQIPGLGRYFVTGALNRDYTLVMGVVIFYGTLIILMNLVVDLLYAWLDPRTRQ